MRHIHLADGMRLRFPGRTEEFDLGVEIGVLAILMDSGLREIERVISTANLEQARALAEKMGYRLTEGMRDDDEVSVVLRFGQARPALKLVHSA